MTKRLKRPAPKNPSARNAVQAPSPDGPRRRLPATGTKRTAKANKRARPAPSRAVPGSTPELLRQVLDALPVGVWIMDRRGRIVQANPAGQAIWAGAKYVGLDQFGEYKAWWAESGKPIQPEEWAGARAITRGETSLNEQIHIQAFDGTHKFILNSAMPILNRAHRITGGIIVNQDITDLKRAQEALQESEEKFRALVEAAPDAMVIANGDGEIVLVNGEAERLFGHAAAKLIGQPLEKLLPARLRELHARHQQNYADHPHKRSMGESRELVARRRNGTEFPVEISLSPVETRGGRLVISIIRDITERKRAEKALRESEARFRLAVDNFPGALVLYDARRRFQVVNATAVALTGIPEAAHLGRTDEQVYPAETTDTYLPALERAIETRLPQAIESAFTGVSGTLTMAVRYIPIVDENGVLLQVLGITEDITERKRAEEQLAHQTARLQEQASLIELAHDAIIVRGPDNRVLFWNQGAEKTYGWTEQEALGQVTHGFLKTEFPESRDQVHKRLLAEGRWEGELRHTTREGRRIVVASRQVLRRDERGEPSAVLEINRDVTERVQAQAALFESTERLRQLANQMTNLQEDERRRISRELHDDAGQALTAARMSLESVEADLPLGFESLRRRVKEATLVIGQTMEQIRTLAQDLRPAALDTVGLHHAAEGYCREFTRRTGLPVHYRGAELDELPDAIKISLYRFLQEGLTNIAKHARASQVQVQLEKENDILRLCVEDDGCGFDSQANPSGRTGLGLIGMRERIQLLGGTMEIDSQPGRGTRLTALVPMEVR